MQLPPPVTIAPTYSGYSDYMYSTASYAAPQGYASVSYPYSSAHQAYAPVSHGYAASQYYSQPPVVYAPEYPSYDEPIDERRPQPYRPPNNQSHHSRPPPYRGYYSDPEYEQDSPRHRDERRGPQTVGEYEDQYRPQERRQKKQSRPPRNAPVLQRDFNERLMRPQNDYTLRSTSLSSSTGPDVIDVIGVSGNADSERARKELVKLENLYPSSIRSGQVRMFPSKDHFRSWVLRQFNEQGLHIPNSAPAAFVNSNYIGGLHDLFHYFGARNFELSVKKEN